MWRDLGTKLLGGRVILDKFWKSQPKLLILNDHALFSLDAHNEMIFLKHAGLFNLVKIVLSETYRKKLRNLILLYNSQWISCRLIRCKFGVVSYELQVGNKTKSYELDFTSRKLKSQVTCYEFNLWVTTCSLQM